MTDMSIRLNPYKLIFMDEAKDYIRTKFEEYKRTNGLDAADASRVSTTDGHTFQIDTLLDGIDFVNSIESGMHMFWSTHPVDASHSIDHDQGFAYYSKKASEWDESDENSIIIY